MGALASSAPGVSGGRVYTCRIGQIRDAGDAKDRKAIDERMDAPQTDYSHRALAVWLGVAEGTIHKHRARRCACYRSNG